MPVENDKFVGEGFLHLSDRSVRLKCVIRSYQDGDRSIPTLHRARGKFENLLHSDAAFAMMDDKLLDLTLEGQRKMRIEVVDFQGHFIVTESFA